MEPVAVKGRWESFLVPMFTTRRLPRAILQFILLAVVLTSALSVVGFALPPLADPTEVCGIVGCDGGDRECATLTFEWIGPIGGDAVGGEVTVSCSES